MSNIYKTVSKAAVITKTGRVQTLKTMFVESFLYLDVFPRDFFISAAFVHF